MAEFQFNAQEVQPATGFDPVPAGTYTAEITDSDMVQTKAGTGHYIKLTFKIIGPTHANRLVWTNLNVDNPNEKAVQIAREQLSAICHATKVMQLNNTEQLHGIPLQVKIVVRQDEQYGASNEIKDFMPADTPQAMGGAPAAAPAAPAGGNSGRPW
jgi:hypothetical protein